MEPVHLTLEIKVDYSVGENIYMLPSNMNLNIRSGTVRYNSKILVSDGKFSLGENDKANVGFANALSAKISRKFTQPTKESNLAQKPTITHQEEKSVFILSLTTTFTIWYTLR